MEAIFLSLQGSLAQMLTYVVPMVVLLGLLIFVHELGHFLVAKYFGVRVEVFSLGFGPKIFKFKRGDTEYAISVIPLGGYVKMFGDDPTSPVTDDEKQFSFTDKPVFQRIAVVLAGPLMNLFFAILIFSVVALTGEQGVSPVVGDIKAGTTAESIGFKNGDEILSIDNQAVHSWDQVQKTIEKSADTSLSILVKHASGQEETLAVVPKLAANKNIMSWDRWIGEIDGLTFSSRASVVGIKDSKSIAGVAGLRTGDMIQTINGKKVSMWRELNGELEQQIQGSKSLVLEIERGLLDPSKKKKDSLSITIEVNEDLLQDGRSAIEKLGIEYPELFIAQIEKNSPAAAAGLQIGDRIMSLNGAAVSSFEDIAKTIRSFGIENNNHDVESQNHEVTTLSVEVSRQGQPVTISVTPTFKERMTPEGREEKRFEIGIRPLFVDAAPRLVSLKVDGFLQATSRGIEQTVKWTGLTILGFVRLFQNEVSAKNIGGFLSIGQMAQKSWSIGISQFLSVMGIISINLFILNLLPVPVLDGGHLVFYSIEALRGAPLSMRKMEIAQQIGMVLLLGLMVFALFNDITRIFYH